MKKKKIARGLLFSSRIRSIDDGYVFYLSVLTNINYRGEHLCDQTWKDSFHLMVEFTDRKYRWKNEDI